MAPQIRASIQPLDQLIQEDLSFKTEMATYASSMQCANQAGIPMKTIIAIWHKIAERIPGFKTELKKFSDHFTVTIPNVIQESVLGNAKAAGIRRI